MLHLPPMHFPRGPQSDTMLRAKPSPTRMLRPHGRPENGTHLPAPLHSASRPHLTCETRCFWSFPIASKLWHNHQAALCQHHPSNGRIDRGNPRGIGNRQRMDKAGQHKQPQGPTMEEAGKMAYFDGSDHGIGFLTGQLNEMIRSIRIELTS